MRRPDLLARIGALACTSITLPGLLAQSALADSPAVDDPDLIQKARAEGSVVGYVAMAAGDIQKFASRFEAEYPGIQVQSLHVLSDQVLAKLSIEQRAGRFAADIAICPGFETDQLKRNGFLTAFRAPEARDCRPEYIDPASYWAMWFLNTDAIGYNTEKLKEYGLVAPASWQDFTRPEWRGRFVLFNGSYEWYASMHRALGEEAAERLMHALAANAPRMVASHQLAIDLTAEGEAAAAINVYGYSVARYKRAGRPVALLNAPPVIGESTCVSIVKNGPHPNAARLFVRWLLARRTQQWLVSPDAIGRVTVRKDVTSDPEIWNPSLKIAVTNPADSVGYAADVRAFNSTFGIVD